MLAIGNALEGLFLDSKNSSTPSEYRSILRGVLSPVIARSIYLGKRKSRAGTRATFLALFPAEGDFLSLRGFPAF